MASELLSRLSLKVTSLVEEHPYLALGTSIYVAAVTLSTIRRTRRGHSTKLPGPRSKSFLFGAASDIVKSEDAALLFEEWSKTYGPIYQVPLVVGAKAIVLMDPKAIASMLAKDTTVYSQPPAFAMFFESNYGKNLLIVDGEDHKRQRRALSTGFSIAAIRQLTSVFYESVHTVEDCWKATIESSGGLATIDVQHWMNSISLDSIGKGGFSHDFGATRGEETSIAHDFAAFGDLKMTFVQMFAFLLSGFIPSLVKLPTERRRLHQSLSGSFGELATKLLEKAEQEKSTGSSEGLDKSIIGALLRAQTGSSNVRMDLDEIRAQINLFMIAGYETTAAALTWTLIELARKPEIQRKLREEVSQLGDEDLSYERLGSDLPYLDAVVCEALRLHPSLADISRTAIEDDILSLAEPIIDASGHTIDRIFVPKGTQIRIPISAVNKMHDLWGEDSYEFNPERWTDDGVSSKKAVEIQGYKHLLTFADGPRTCLGKLFAWTEIKVVLSVLVRNFSFELPDGPETKIDKHRGMLLRPKIAGEKGARVPLLVRRVD